MGEIAAGPPASRCPPEESGLVLFAEVCFGASSLIRYVVGHRLQSADSGPSIAVEATGENAEIIRLYGADWAARRMRQFMRRARPMIIRICREDTVPATPPRNGPSLRGGRDVR